MVVMILLSMLRETIEKGSKYVKRILHIVELLAAFLLEVFILPAVVVFLSTLCIAKDLIGGGYFLKCLGCIWCVISIGMKFKR